MGDVFPHCVVRGSVQMIGVSKKMHRILHPLGKDDSPIGGRKASLLKGVQNLYDIVHPPITTLLS